MYLPNVLLVAVISFTPDYGYSQTDAEIDLFPSPSFAEPSASDRLQNTPPLPPISTGPSIFDTVRESVTVDGPGETRISPTWVTPCCGGDGSGVPGVNIEW